MTDVRPGILAGDTSQELNVRDFNTKSIKLHLVDPHDPSKKTKVLLSLAHVVRMVPQYYLENEGKRMVTEVPDDDAAERQRGIKRTFVIHDDIGGRYESGAASRQAQALLEQVWAECG